MRSDRKETMRKIHKLYFSNQEIKEVIKAIETNWIRENLKELIIYHPMVNRYFIPLQLNRTQTQYLK